jgi:AbrB family looped-hinge helix DNA binding protein
MKTSISTKGQIVLPAELREQDGIQPGQQFEIERKQPGEYLLKRITKPAKKSLFEWLSECPENDWFQPIPSESTDRIKSAF